MFENGEYIINDYNELYQFFKLRVAKNGQKADLILKRLPKNRVTSKAITDFLIEHKVKMGHIEEYLSDRFFDMGLFKETKTLLIAQAKPPVYPEDAKIQYNFESYPSKPGTLKEDGGIDFKDRGIIPHVKINDVIAEKIAAKGGDDGYDIFGNTTEVESPKDIKLTPGKGVYISKDKLKIHARVDGMPIIGRRNTLSVVPKLEIEGDIDFTTGHVIFDGAVIVQGTVKPGFKVKCDTLLANEISRAKVETKRNLVVNGAVVGSLIKCGGSVEAMLLNSTKILCLGDVNIHREIIESHIEVKGRCDVEKGRIIASKVMAGTGISAKRIGSVLSNPCIITIGLSSMTMKSIRQPMTYSFNQDIILSKKTTKEFKGIEVAEGIIGAKVRTIGGIKAESIQMAKIFAIGSLNIRKEIRESKVETARECDIVHGRIDSSTINAYQGIHSKYIGPDESYLYIGVKNQISKILDQIKEKVINLEIDIQELKDSVSQSKIQLKENEGLHKSFIQLKDKLKAAEKQIEQSLKTFPGKPTKSNAERLKKLKLSHKKIQEKHQDVINSLTNNLESHEKISNEIDHNTTVLEIKQKRYEILQKKIKFYSKWVISERPDPVITVSETISKDVQIHGSDSFKILWGDYKGVHITESGKILNEKVKNEIVIKPIEKR